MECKFETDLTPEEIIAELIDTLWNVNLNSATAIVTPAAELIDTLWNVNKAFRRRSVGNISELIDTLWNVNIHHATSLGCSALRINRYIMECKSRVQEHIKRR